jgi:hypothetical protein
MQQRIDSRLLRGLSIYQDVVIDGLTVCRGTRDCSTRWEILDPHLPRHGAILDVGSNFGWFGLQICRSRPDCVVASAEADLRSAAVQYEVLRSHQHDRICLLTQKASLAMARRFAAAGQRLEAVLLLSVLHWIGDHRQFLAMLGPITGRFLIEQPDPREDGAGVERIRREIGVIGDYLRDLFPQRPVQCLARLPSHRDSAWPREVWLVDEPADWPPTAATGLDADALLDLAPGWPPRSWWRTELARAGAADGPGPSQCLFTPRGLSGSGLDSRRLRAIPERAAFTWQRFLALRARRLAGAVLGRLKHGVRP